MIGPPKYIQVMNTALNSVDCSDSAAADEFAKQPENKSMFDNSLVLLFRWGKGQDKPNYQGCSGGIEVSYISMPAYDFLGDQRVGQLVLGNNLFTHELGHYMSLMHVFPSAADEIAGIAFNKNPKRLPLVPQYLNQMESMTATEMSEAKKRTLERIATWPYILDQDVADINDTPVEEKKDNSGKIIWWKPKEGITESDQYVETVTVNDTVRRNIP